MIDDTIEHKRVETIPKPSGLDSILPADFYMPKPAGVAYDPMRALIEFTVDQCRPYEH